MRRFLIIWSGQFVSLLGTGMTRFALIVHVFHQEGTATSVAMIGLANFLPYVIVSPIAGVWVDRLDRKAVMLSADLAAGLATFGLLVVEMTGDLGLWHIYAAGAIAGAAEAFQVPAFTAVTTSLVDRSQYMRISGLRSLAESAGQVAAPGLAGVALLVTDLRGVLLVDLVSFVFAVATLAPVRLPRSTSATPQDVTSGRPSVWSELGVAIDFIRGRPGLLGLTIVFIGINLFAALTYYALLPVLVLSRTGNDPSALASVEVALGVGGVVGGLLVAAWGGPRRRIHAVLAGAALSFASGDLLFAVGRGVGVWIPAALIASIYVPFIVGADQAIWQSKTPPALQGRVFALRGMIRLASMPVGYAVAGPLVDRVFDPLMAPGGRLAGTLGGLIGYGPGAGVALMFLGTAVLGTAASLIGYLVPAIRNVEDELPDHAEESAPDGEEAGRRIREAVAQAPSPAAGEITTSDDWGRVEWSSRDVAQFG